MHCCIVNRYRTIRVCSQKVWNGETIRSQHWCPNQADKQRAALLCRFDYDYAQLCGPVLEVTQSVAGFGYPPSIGPTVAIHCCSSCACSYTLFSLFIYMPMFYAETSHTFTVSSFVVWILYTQKEEVKLGLSSHFAIWEMALYDERTISAHTVSFSYPPIY